MKGFNETSFFFQNLPMYDHFAEKNSGKNTLFFQIPPLNEEIFENIQKFTKKWKMNVF